jgi:hypothetical protein
VEKFGNKIVTRGRIILPASERHTLKRDMPMKGKSAYLKNYYMQILTQEVETSKWTKANSRLTTAGKTFSKITQRKSTKG